MLADGCVAKPELCSQMRSGGSGQPYPPAKFNLALVEAVLLLRLLNCSDYPKSKQLLAGEMVFDVVVAALRDSENDSESACFHTLYSPLRVDVENYSMVFTFRA